MTDRIAAPGAPRRTESYAQTTATGAAAALPKTGADEPKGMDDETAKTLGNRLLAVGGVLLAGSVALVELGARAAGIETGMSALGGAGLMTLLAGMTATTVGATLRFPKFFGSWLPDERKKQAA